MKIYQISLNRITLNSVKGDTQKYIWLNFFKMLLKKNICMSQEIRILTRVFQRVYQLFLSSIQQIKMLRMIIQKLHGTKFKFLSIFLPPFYLSISIGNFRLLHRRVTNHSWPTCYKSVIFDDPWQSLLGKAFITTAAMIFLHQISNMF